MAETLEFDKVYEFSLFKTGILLEITLSYFDRSVGLEANIDTGSTYCIFERHYADDLEIEVETGMPMMIGTATGSFQVFGHEVTLNFLGIETVSTVHFAESDLFYRNVLGRTGWLDRIKLGLIEPEGKLYMSEYKQ